MLVWGGEYPDGANNLRLYIHRLGDKIEVGTHNPDLGSAIIDISYYIQIAQ